MDTNWINLEDGYNEAPSVDSGHYYKKPVAFYGDAALWKGYKFFCLEPIYHIIRDASGTPLVDFDLVKQFLFEHNIEPNEADVLFFQLNQKVSVIKIQGMPNLDFTKVVAVSMTNNLGSLFYDFLKGITFKYEEVEWRLPIGTASIFVDQDPNKFLQISVPVPVKKNQEIKADPEGRLNILNLRA